MVKKPSRARRRKPIPGMSREESDEVRRQLAAGDEHYQRVASAPLSFDDLLEIRDEMQAKVDAADERARDLLGILTEYIEREAPRRTARATRQLRAEARAAEDRLARQSDVMDLDETAELLGLSTRTILRRVREGMPHSYIGTNRHLRFSRAEVEAWARRQSTDHPQRKKRRGTPRIHSRPHAPGKSADDLAPRKRAKKKGK